jgi:protein phosphatase
MSAYTLWAARTDTGLVRETNEDSAYAGRWFYAVADGMGGHTAGEVASATVITSLSRHDKAVPAEQLTAAIGAAVLGANAAIHRQVDADPSLTTMSTTLTAMLWSGHGFALAHIGDSRAYLVRGGQLRQLTTDHSLANLVGNAGASILAPIMTRYLDGRPDRSPDLRLLEALPGDRYMLCTDGLSGVLPAAELASGMTAAGSPDVRAEWLTSQAIARGGPDNVTVILIDVPGGVVRQPAPALFGSAVAGQPAHT